MDDRFVDIESVVDLSDIIDALQDLSAEELLAHGLSADSTWDEIDDPVLIGPNGLPVDDLARGLPVRRADDPRRVRGQPSGPAADRAAQAAGLGEGHRPEAGRRSSRVGTPPARAARSSGSPSTSTPVAPAWWRWRSRRERERGQWYFQRYVAAPADRGRDRAVRPVLVQPGRRRAGDGLLHRGGVRRVHARRPPSSSGC